MKVLLTLGALCITGCSTIQSTAIVASSIALDSLTTHTALKAGTGREANPLYGTSVDAAVFGSILLKVGILAVVRQASPNLCEVATRAVISSSLGAATNNYGVHNGWQPSTSLTSGLAVGAVSFLMAKPAAVNFCK